MENNDNELKEIASSLIDTEKSAVATVIGEIHKEVIVKKAPNKAIPENFFKNDFLPFFKGEQSPVFKNVHPKIEEVHPLRLWLSIAGGYDKEVDVIDRSGKVLYTVPKIYKQEVVATDILNKSKSDKTLSKMGDEYTNLAKAGDVRATNVVNTAISNMPKFIKSIDDPIHDEDKKRWKEIFERYDNPTQSNKKPLTKKEKDILNIIYPD